MVRFDLRRAATGSFAVAALFAVALAPAARAGIAVVGQGGTVAGRSLPQYTADWWQSALEVPFAQSPLSGAEPTARDVGAVTFLYGQSEGTVTRSATIQDDFVFLPVLNAFFAITSLDPPGTTEADARAALGGAIDETSNLFASVDGQALSESAIRAQRERSPVFTLDLPDDNALGIPPEFIDVTVSDGYWLMLEPLGPGEHTIRFGGDFGPSFGNASLDVTYNVTVVPLPAAVLIAPALLPMAWLGRRLIMRRRR